VVSNNTNLRRHERSMHGKETSSSGDPDDTSSSPRPMIKKEVLPVIKKEVFPVVKKEVLEVTNP